jgi:hypothetical protein
VAPPSCRLNHRPVDSQVMELDRKLIPAIVEQVNYYLRGERHQQLAKVIPGSTAFGREWLACLRSTKLPPRTDGKSLGTCIEKLLKAEISRSLNIILTGSAAAGVDIPELSLNTKATSDRQPQSSEPFDSPYERLLGAKYDILACIYNGIEFLKSQKNLPIQINAAMYYARTEVADMQLCATARLLRDLYTANNVDERLARRTLRSIVYAKKSGPGSAGYKVLKNGISKGDLTVIRAAVEAHEEEMATEGEIGLPKEKEWVEFKTSPLNGKIGISFALQWRYQFDVSVEDVRYF